MRGVLIVASMTALTASDLKRLRKAILAEIAEIEAAEASTAGDQKPIALDQQSVGRLSRMDAMQQQAMSRATRARRLERKRVLEATLPRLTSDAYGYCAECADPIGLKRLRFNPALTRCLDCIRGAE